MKLKGINPIEQHIEKLVLVAMALVLLVVLAMQFLLQPNQVDAGGRKIPPQDIYKTLESQATSLDAQLKDLNPALPDVPEMDLVDRYDSAFARKGLGEDVLSASFGPGVSVGRLVGADIEGAAPSSEDVSPLRVPSTSGVVAASQWATLDPYAVETVPAYEAFVPNSQPYDFASVSIESLFSGQELADALSAEEGAGIPRRFWQGTGIAIMAFEVERQRRLPDGTWSSAEPIVTPPTTPIPTLSMPTDAGLPELTGIVSNALQASSDIERPAPPPTIAGPQWFPPTERIEVDEGELSEGDLIRRRLQRAEADLNRLEARPPPGRDQQRPGGGKGRTTDPGGGRDTNDRSRERIDQLREEIRELRRRLRELGEDEPDRSAGATRARTDEAEPLVARDEVRLWAHDLGVEPGSEYRYRTRVAINNPLFRKGPVLDPDDDGLQAASEEPFSRGAWSGWSEPVTVGRAEYYFVSAASPDGGPGGQTPTASVEAYRMFYGSYRRSTLSLNPGDALRASLRMPGGLFLIDTAQIEASEAAEVFAAAAQEDPAEALSLPVGVTEPEGRLVIDLGAYVLDIVTRPVQAPDQFGTMRPVGEVILMDREGRVVSRTTVEDTTSPAYALARTSAAEASDLVLRAPGQPAENPSASLFPRAISDP
ncbi:MAG: hypothetical protein AAGA55_05255 [Planctomycetota bacterium]